MNKAGRLAARLLAVHRGWGVFSQLRLFRNASVNQLFNVEFSHGHHFYWPDLDVDLERIRLPEKFPPVTKP
jgi:hypothetical protein